MKKILFIFLLCFIGCSPLEFTRLIGAGTERFREAGKIYTKEFDVDLSSCYKRISLELRDIGVSFYRGSQEEGFVVVNNFVKIFPQCNESTEVAIFFTELSSSKVQVEVISLNYSLAEAASLKIFDCLEGREKEYIKS